MRGPDRTLQRLLRKPAVSEYMAREIARIGIDHVVTDSEGLALLGTKNGITSAGCPVMVHDRLIGFVHGRHADALARLILLLVAQDDEVRALGRESLDRYREVTMLYSLSERIIGATDPGTIAGLLCEEAERFLRCDSAAALLLNPETNRLEIAATRGAPFHDRATREIEDDVVASVLRSGIGEIINDVHADPRSLAGNHSLRSVICSPLKAHDRVFGVLVAGAATQREFSAGELQALNSMAAHAAASIEAARLERDLKSKSRKPVNLIYGVDERPPLAISLLLAFQHVLIAVMSLAYPVIVTLEAGGSRATAAAVVSMSLVAMGGASLLQVLRRGPIGSGYLAPFITSAIYLGPSLLAARHGGLSLVFGMTMVAGVAVIALSQLMQRFRKLFPPEVSGVVVLMVGLSIVPVALPRLLGVSGAEAASNPAEWAVGILTLAVIVSLSVLPFGRLRLYATAVGLGIGYVAAAVLGVWDPMAASHIRELPMLGMQALPVDSLAFAPSLIVPFVAAALASSIKEAGLIISCQKTNDSQWKRPNMRSMSGGLVASGVGSVVAGGLGGLGLGISAGSVGLAAATGSTSRIIGVWVALMFAALAFMPKLTALLALVPSPVMGAGLLYVACHLVSSGAELITSRMLDARRNYVIGLPLLAGIGIMVAPALVSAAPTWSQAVLSSPLAVSTILALGLNLALNAGVSNRAEVRVTLDATASDVISAFFERQGAAWGARSDVVRRAAPAVIEWCEELRYARGATHAGIKLDYDEFRLVATISDVSPRPGAASAQQQSVTPPDHVANTIARRYDCSVRLMDDGSARVDFEH